MANNRQPGEEPFDIDPGEEDPFKHDGYLDWIFSQRTFSPFGDDGRFRSSSRVYVETLHSRYLRAVEQESAANKRGGDQVRSALLAAFHKSSDEGVFWDNLLRRLRADGLGDYEFGDFFDDKFYAVAEEAVKSTADNLKATELASPAPKGPGPRKKLAEREFCRGICSAWTSAAGRPPDIGDTSTFSDPNCAHPFALIVRDLIRQVAKATNHPHPGQLSSIIRETLREAHLEADRRAAEDAQRAADGDDFPF